jgi:DNA-binding Lrp family transcriptional regulator
MKISDGKTKNQIGYVCIMSEVGKEQEIVEATKKIEGVEGAWAVYGVYDIIIKIVATDMKVLGKLVEKQIRKIPNIRSTLTFLVIED